VKKRLRIVGTAAEFSVQVQLSRLDYGLHRIAGFTSSTHTELTDTVSIVFG